MTEYTDIASGRILTWDEALRHLLDSGPTDAMVAEFMAREEGRFRRFPDDRRKAEAMIEAARPPWVRPRYEAAVEALAADGLKPTDARVAERLGTDARTIRRWRHDGLLR